MNIQKSLSDIVNSVFPYTASLAAKVKKLEERVIAERGMQEMEYTSYDGFSPISYTWQDLDYISKHSVVIALCINKLRQEIFREGIKIVPAFQTKCVLCQSEYGEYKTGDTCPACGNQTLIEPDPIQKRKLEGKIKSINKNNQSILDLLKTIEDDLQIYDQAYLLFRKKYTLNAKNEIIHEEIDEIVRIHPADIKLLITKEGNVKSNIKINLSTREIDKTSQYTAIAESVYGKKKYYIAGEIFWINKYKPSITYGYSPILTAYTEIYTLMKQDERLAMIYTRNRVSGIFAFPTKNPDAIENVWTRMMTLVRKDPHYIPQISIDPDARTKPEYIKLSDTFSDLQFIETKKELRQRICALYGVPDVFQGDLSNSSGLNNETQQIVVLNRSVADAQQLHNTKTLEAIVKAYNISDWKLELSPSERQDIAQEKQNLQIDLSNAEQALRLGLKVVFKNGTIDIAEGDMKAPEIPQPYIPSEIGTNEKTGTPITRGIIIEKAKVDFLLDAIKLGVLWDKYEGLSRRDSLYLNSLIVDNILKEEWNYKDIVKKLIDRVGISEEQATTIVRTEIQAVEEKARELSFIEQMKKEGKEYKFKWSITHDDRTSEICKDIEEAVSKKGKGKGVYLNELKQIITEVVEKRTGEKPKRDFPPHINCRSSLVRVVE